MPEFLSIKDAARRLGVKPKEIRRRIKDGELDGFVRLAGGSSDETAGSGFGPAAPNRRAAPPPEREAHAQRLEETVLVLQSELNARRQEVAELHVLLREIKEGLAAREAPAVAAPSPAPSVAASAGAAPSAVPAQTESGEPPAEAPASAAVSAPTAEAAAASPAEPEIDWNAYDAESEQLRATMGRLEALLEQLESEPEPEPTLELAPVLAPESEPALAQAPEPGRDLEPVPMAGPSQEPEPVQAAARVESVASVSQAVPAVPAPRPAVQEPTPAAPKPTSAPSRPRAATKSASPPAAQADDAPNGDALGRRRERMGVSREALAAFARFSWGFITEVESGRRKDLRSRQRLAAALDAWQKRLADERRKAGGT